MKTNNPQGKTWEEFKREFGLDSRQTPERCAARGATLAPLRAEVERLGVGRPPKQSPVPLSEGMKFCWSCRAALPVASFYANPRAADGYRMDCRGCDATARARRKRERNARLKSQSNNGGGVSAIQ